MRRGLHAAIAAFVIAVFPGASASAWAEPSLPIFEGAMSFPAIQGFSDSEEFSWEVTLSKDQELRQDDDQLAEVFYVDTEHIAFAIVAGPAHDAIGTDVPTSLGVSEGNVLTLTVHHRAGNPARGGAPFDYPVMAGAGWEGGFQTTYVVMPPPKLSVETVESPSMSIGCVAPALAGKGLKSARRRLRRAGCKLGRVSGRRSKDARVVRQNPPPGELLAPGAEVSLALAHPRA